jgi:hypothetical protein
MKKLFKLSFILLHHKAYQGKVRKANSVEQISLRKFKALRKS